MKKYLHYTKDQQAAIDRLHKLLEAQGVNTKDPKRGGYSDSALFRWLVDEKLKEIENER